MTASCEHVEPSAHPPLSMVHEKSQYAVSVSSHTLQIDPVGHWKPVQAVMKENMYKTRTIAGFARRILMMLHDTYICTYVIIRHFY